MDYENQHIVPVDINREMKRSYIEYAMSVIVARALPDVRDGLKPVHRRILYTMYEDGLTFDKPFRKAATTVGAVLGRYHPHGDASVYDALVRLAQDFSMRAPLIDGHGNFGSIDGDPPAAYRYTEARMSKIAAEMLTEIDRETVDMMPNFDDRLKEPTVLPARFPCLLVNGSQGIAVGMTTNIPPHNLGEVLDAVVYLIDNPEAGVPDLMQFIKGPDFPTGAVIMGTAGIRETYATGHGSFIVRAKAEIQEHGERATIVVTELPYGTNKSRLMMQIADCVNQKRIEGIADLDDESGRDGLKIRFDLKRDANAQVVLNQLFTHTGLQTSFSANVLALVDGEPKTLPLKDMLTHYIDFQKEIVVRRTRFDLKKAKARAHLLEGLRIACDHIDEVIRIIRESYDEARERLMERFGLSQIQAQAILDMQLKRLQGLEREKIEAEYADLQAKIAGYEQILQSEELVLGIVKEESAALKAKYADPRRTAIEPSFTDIEDEDLIDREDCVITRSHLGYVKRQPMSGYRAQHRGGRGITGMTTREEDFVEDIFVANTHSYIMFFTDRGRVFRLKGYQIPVASRTAKGVNMVNLISMDPGEKVTAVIHLESFEEGYLTMITKLGVIKRTELAEFANVRRSGLRAIALDEGDDLSEVKLTDGMQDMIVCTRLGKAIRFTEEDVRVIGRPGRGVRAIDLAAGDSVVGMCIVKEGAKLFTVTELGYGKRTDCAEYRRQSRGGMGLLNYNLTDKTGPVAGVAMVSEDDDLLLVTDGGVVIRMDAAEIPVYSRVTQGVRVMRIGDGLRLVTVTLADKEEDEADGLDETGETDETDEENGADSFESNGEPAEPDENS
ncbi:MAG TPA: DNA gyrase subunit A [Candidatus Acidoferrum sp.]|nr:DNA gyrase subunit A [Candidatus Acidoferrum sp.]